MCVRLHIGKPTQIQYRKCSNLKNITKKWETIGKIKYLKAQLTEAVDESSGS